MGEPLINRGLQPAILRILDANLDRAREGLRIVEDWCRFGLNDRSSTEQCKGLRQELARWHSLELRLARDTPGDTGTQLTHPQESTRTSINHLLQANLSRIEEALRVLEEYGKLYAAGMGAACKQMRYEVYTLGSQVLCAHRRQLLQTAQLYLVTSPSDRLAEVVEAALQGGLPVVQYRDKATDDRVRLERAQQLADLCHRYNALFLVNDRVDLALAVNADGVHLGQKDIPIETARQLLGPHRLIGQSTTNPEELARALEAGADYVGVGPIYATPTKPGKAAAGLDYAAYAEQHSTIPWFAIGGIDAQNLSEVMAAGVRRVAVVRALMEAEQPSVTAQYLLSRLQFSRSRPSRSASSPDGKTCHDLP